jgi:hypothetical protein
LHIEAQRSGQVLSGTGRLQFKRHRVFDTALVLVRREGQRLRQVALGAGSVVVQFETQ